VYCFIYLFAFANLAASRGLLVLARNEGLREGGKSRDSLGDKEIKKTKKVLVNPKDNLWPVL
jgi:hypothetical protein